MKFSVRIGARERWVEVLPDGAAWRILLDGADSAIDAAELAPGVYSVLASGRSREVAVERERELTRVRIQGAVYEMTVLDEVRARAFRAPRPGAAHGPATLRAPMPGLVVALKARAGEEVREGQPLLVIEAMKMQNELAAPAAGKVETIHVEPGQSVEGGQVLVTLSPAAPGETP